MKVSVIVPTRKRVEYLRNLLRNLSEQSQPPDEVILATTPQDKKTVEFLDYIGSEFQGMKIITIIEKGGTAKLRNLGVAKSSGKAVVFLDDDIILDRDYFRNLRKTFSRKDVNVVTGYTFDLVDLTTPWFAKKGDLRYIKTRNDEFTRILKLYLRERGLDVERINYLRLILWRVLKLMRNTLKSMFLWESPFKGKILPSGYRSEFPEITKLKGIVEVEWVQGNNFSAKREVLLKFPFNEELERRSSYALNEDLEWSARVGLKYKIYLSPDLKAIHLRAPGMRLDNEKRLEALLESTYLIAKIRGNSIAHLWSSLGLLTMNLISIPITPSKGVKNSRIIIKTLKRLYL